MPMTRTPLCARMRAVWMPGKQSRPIITAEGRHREELEITLGLPNFTADEVGRGQDSVPTWALRKEMFCGRAWRLPTRSSLLEDTATRPPQAPRHFAAGRSPLPAQCFVARPLQSWCGG